MMSRMMAVCGFGRRWAVMAVLIVNMTIMKMRLR